MSNCSLIEKRRSRVGEKEKKGKGISQVIDTSDVGNPYLFQGRRWDGAMGLYYYRNRYYSPTTGRFISQDPMGVWWDPVAEGNGYQSFSSNTLKYMDSSGYITKEWDDCSNKWNIYNNGEKVGTADLTGFFSDIKLYGEEFETRPIHGGADSMCEIHHGKWLKKIGVHWNLECVCKKTGTTRWEKFVRGLLYDIEDNLGLDPEEAHEVAYLLADNKFSLLGVSFRGNYGRLKVGLKDCWEIRIPRPDLFRLSLPSLPSLPGGEVPLFPFPGEVPLPLPPELPW